MRNGKRNGRIIKVKWRKWKWNSCTFVYERTVSPLRWARFPPTVYRPLRTLIFILFSWCDGGSNGKNCIWWKKKFLYLELNYLFWEWLSFQSDIRRRFNALLDILCFPFGSMCGWWRRAIAACVKRASFLFLRRSRHYNFSISFHGSL